MAAPQVKKMYEGTPSSDATSIMEEHKRSKTNPTSFAGSGPAVTAAEAAALTAAFWLPTIWRRLVSGDLSDSSGSTSTKLTREFGEFLVKELILLSDWSLMIRTVTERRSLRSVRSFANFMVAKRWLMTGRGMNIKIGFCSDIFGSQEM